jgi:hypothetical protein
MTTFSTREKCLIGIIITLFALTLFLSFKLIEYKINVFLTTGYEDSEDPSMSESIKKASVIFICKTVIESETVKYRISEIIYKDDEYDFPYSLGAYYPKLQRPIETGIHYGEGRVVILSSKGPIVSQNLQIMGGTIPGFEGITVDDFNKNVKKIKD